MLGFIRFHIRVLYRSFRAARDLRELRTLIVRLLGIESGAVIGDGEIFLECVTSFGLYSCKAISPVRL